MICNRGLIALNGVREYPPPPRSSLTSGHELYWRGQQRKSREEVLEKHGDGQWRKSEWRWVLFFGRGRNGDGWRSV